MSLGVVKPDSVNTGAPASIRDEVLRDPRYPVHKIADRLLPYLRVLVEQFQPQQVILFGSYAYGNPDEHSDVDLIIIKELKNAPVREASEIRKAWRPIRWSGNSLPFDLLVLDEEAHLRRLETAAGFYDKAIAKGLRLV